MKPKGNDFLLGLARTQITISMITANNNNNKGLMQITLHIAISKSSQRVQRLKVRIYRTWLQMHGSCLSTHLRASYVLLSTLEDCSGEEGYL